MLESRHMTDELRTADIDLIKRIIPHRYPFLMVDRVREINGATSAVGVKNVTFNEPHFQGHFPEAPIMPGVTIVEAMAQTAAVMVGMAQDVADKGFLIYFLAIDRCKFRNKVVPGDVLELHVETVRGGSRIWRFKGRGLVRGNLVAQAEFTAMIDRSAAG